MSGGAEATVHCFVVNKPDDHVLVKLDFTNAFNSIWRDNILDSVEDNMPELYRFIQWSLDCSIKRLYGDDVIEYVEGSQQSDPLSNLEY